MLNQVTNLARNYESYLCTSDVSRAAMNSRREDHIGWEPPMADCLKLNVDESVSSLVSAASCGSLIRDYQGRVTADFMLNLGKCSIIMAEIWGLYVRIKLAFDLGVRKLMIETDSVCAFCFVQTQTSVNGVGTPLLQAMKLLLAQSWSMQIHHIYGKRNVCANLLAKKAQSILMGLSCFSSHLAFLSYALIVNALGVKFLRIIG
ncbi:hypothetical protein AHAS_Ahas13G0372600 [Arachis hypogaea]